MNEFIKRTVYGALFVVVLVFGIIWDRLLCGCLFLLVLYICLKEFYGVSLGERSRALQRMGMLTALLAFCAVSCHVYFDFSIRFLALAFVFLLLIPVTAVLFSDRENIMDVGTVYAGLLYIAFPISLVPFITTEGEVFSGWTLLSLFIVDWMCDIGAYCIGSLFGRGEKAAKMAPVISPHKTWWGFGGGFVFSMAAAVVLQQLWWLPCNIWHALAVGALVCLGGTMGDLFESLWKRHFGIKDSGRFLPGHGGALDRFDSALVAIPLAACYLALVGQL